MAETFYDVLGVGVDASQADVQAAYRERVKETHPDLNDASDASDAFQRVQAAEEVLGDPDERARYDRLGHASYTTHFSGSRDAGDGRRWDVGTDRRADDVDASAASSRNRGSRATETDGFGATYGFDPGAYDRTGQDGRHVSGNPSERSYDVSGGTDSAERGGTNSAERGGDDRAERDDDDTSATGATASASDPATDADRNATAAGGRRAAAGAGSTATASTASAAGGASSDWRERAERTGHRWRKAAQREGRGTIEDDGGYSVHDWNDEELETPRRRYELDQSEAVLVGVTFLLYPFMAYSAVAPQFSLFVNVTVAGCALALTMYVLTMPRVGLYVFGAWSVFAPAFLFVAADLQVVSLLGVVVLGAAWIPFGYSVLFCRVLD